MGSSVDKKTVGTPRDDSMECSIDSADMSNGEARAGLTAGKHAKDTTNAT